MRVQIYGAAFARPIFEPIIPLMESTPTSEPTPPTPSRRMPWRALALAMAAVVACTLLGRHALTKAALQVAASAAQVELSLDEVRLSLFPLTLTCTELSAQTLDGQHRWHLDRLKAGPASMADGSCTVQQLTLGHLHWDVFEATTHKDSTSSVPFDMTSTWKDIWASLPWSSLHLGELTWDSLSWAGTSGAKVHVDGGLWTDWSANPMGILVENGRWGSGAWTAHEGAEPWTSSPGQVRAKWDMDGWDLESPGFDLPGLRWEGRLTWPLQTSQGRVAMDWDVLKALAKEWRQEDLTWPKGLHGQTSALQWSWSDDGWRIGTEDGGPVALEVSGNEEVWQAKLQLASTLWMSGATIQAWTAEAEGNTNVVTWKILGGDAVRLHGTVTPTRPWSSEHRPWSTEATCTWRMTKCLGWADAPKGGLSGVLAFKNNGIGWRVEQAKAQLPWSMEGMATADALPFNGRIPASLLFSEGMGSIDLEGAVKPPTSLQPFWSWRLQGLWDKRNEDVFVWQGTWHPEGRIQSKTRGWGQTTEVRLLQPPPSWNDWAKGIVNLKGGTWPVGELKAELSPKCAFLNALPKDIQIFDTVRFEASVHQQVLDGQFHAGEMTLYGQRLDSVEARLQGQQDAWSLSSLLSADDASLNAKISADTAWHVDMHGSLTGVGHLHLRGSAQPSTNEVWKCRLDHGAASLIAETTQALDVALLNPLEWQTQQHSLLPTDFQMRGSLGSFECRSEADSTFRRLTWSLTGGEEALSWAQRSWDLKLGNLGVSGDMFWQQASLASMPAFRCELEASGVQWATLKAPAIRAQAQSVGQEWDYKATAWESQDRLWGTLAGRSDLGDPSGALFPLDFSFQRIPAAWVHAWVDTNVVGLEGTCDVVGSWDGSVMTPSIRGRANLNALELKVPSLGTSFQLDGALDILPDAVLMDQATLTDEQGHKTQVVGALFHEGLDQINLDISCIDMEEPMRIMNLPPSIDAPFYGILDGQGEVDVSWWGNQVTVMADAKVLGETDVKMSLDASSEESWEDFLSFASLPDSEVILEGSHEPHKPPLSVMLQLQIEATEEAQMTLLTDAENDANLVGRTKGHLDLTLEDWDRIQLAGQLAVVEGQYDFALGPYVRKTFQLKPGGVLRWDGDPYKGSMDLEATYRTRANVTPLVGDLGGQGNQNETIEVVLHLRNDMLLPNIGFDLEAPDAENVVQAALQSALIDETERTSQAIALLSLQEFLPSEVNSLELGSLGFQTNSIDVLTSQLSRWLSGINDDLEIGISYDGTGQEPQDPAATQDALQLALKASFLDDKLEVEGALGSSGLTQEDLGEAHIQNVRVLYNLKENKSLQLTGFSEAANGNAQVSNAVTQGIGIRWHRSFQWRWPWQRIPVASSVQAEVDQSPSDTAE